MKLRSGFVSNSSSSSFCILATGREDIVRQLLMKEFGLSEIELDDIEAVWEKTQFEHGCAVSKNFLFVGNEEPELVGVNAEPLLQKYSIPEAAKIVAKKFKEAGVSVSPNDIAFRFGEWGS